MNIRVLTNSKLEKYPDIVLMKHFRNILIIRTLQLILVHLYRKLGVATMISYGWLWNIAVLDP